MDLGSLWAAISGTSLVVPVLGALALIAAAWLGTRAAASINADAQKQIARINVEAQGEIARASIVNARRVEEIKGDYQRKLEQDKFAREWRRDRVKPFVEKLEELRSDGQTSMGEFRLVAGRLVIPYTEEELEGMAESSRLSMRREVTSELIGLCPASLLERLDEFLQQWGDWLVDLGSWQDFLILQATSDRERRIERESEGQQLWDRCQKSFNVALHAFGRFGSAVDDYVYEEHESRPTK